MFRALNTAATGMIAQQTNIDVIAHNMANVNTTGFHRMRAQFQDLLYQTVRAPGGRDANGQALPTGLQVGEGTRLVATQHIDTQGTMLETGNKLDVAVEGAGFFRVQLPNGDIAYTRAGNFTLDGEGRVVNPDGFSLDPGVQIPEGSEVAIAADGTISITRPGEEQSEQIGQIQLAGFVNTAGLQAMGRNLYKPTDASGQPIMANPGEAGLGTVVSGFLEGSNVEVVNEMIDLITSQRAYEVNQRVIQAADEMLRKTTER